MSEIVFISTALCLPAADIAALIQGRSIIALSQVFVTPMRTFALYPGDRLLKFLSLEQYYRPNFLPIAQTVLNGLNSETVTIQAWAKCEWCEILNTPESLANISGLSIWNTQAFEQILWQHHYIFLTYLRVYWFPKPLEIPTNSQANELLGKFVGLPESVTIKELQPVISDRIFLERRQQLENRQLPLYPELEALHDAIAHLEMQNSVATPLSRHLKTFLGWQTPLSSAENDSDLEWIQTIATVGNSSEGNDFEKLVRKAFIKLGFSCSNTNSKANLDPEKVGGSSGLDFYCEFPYPVAGECKASQYERIPKRVCTELVDLGILNLGRELYEQAIKLIIAAGPLVPIAKKSAIEQNMNVIRPETLQKLVEYQTKYQIFFNLLELRTILEQPPFGEEADIKLNRYLEQIESEINLRSRLIQAVKELTQQTNPSLRNQMQDFSVVEIRVQHNAKNNLWLSDDAVRDLLIELSSILTGYLGRRKAADGSDRFYFLRDFSINEQ